MAVQCDVRRVLYHGWDAKLLDPAVERTKALSLLLEACHLYLLRQSDSRKDVMMANRDNLSGITDHSVNADRGFDFYQPGYRYGYESATRHRGRKWTDVESDLRTGWDRYEHRGQGTWENVQDAVRDAWNRVTGR